MHCISRLDGADDGDDDDDDGSDDDIDADDDSDVHDDEMKTRTVIGTLIRMASEDIRMMLRRGGGGAG
eukprot:2712008-Pyramimonas_sp.AAC.1